MRAVGGCRGAEKTHWPGARGLPQKELGGTPVVARHYPSEALELVELALDEVALPAARESPLGGMDQ